MGITRANRHRRSLSDKDNFGIIWLVIPSFPAHLAREGDCVDNLPRFPQEFRP